MTPSNYAAFTTTVDTSIGAIYEQMKNALVWREYTREVAMTGGSQMSFGWTGKSPRPRPWFGSRMVYETAPQTYTVSPIPYESTLGMDRFILDDSDPNAMSIFWRNLPEMAAQWAKQPELEQRDLLENVGVQTGARQNGLDTLTFFNTAHTIDFYNPTLNAGALFSSGTYCNDFIGTQTINGTVLGGALSTVALTGLCEYASMVPGEDGESLGVNMDALIVPGTLKIEANYVLKATFLAAPTWGAFSSQTGQVGPVDNMLRKEGLRPIVNRSLKKPLRYYLADTTHTEQPLLWVVREAPRTVPRIAENDPVVFDSHKYLWGGWDRVCPAWGYSFLMLRSAPSGG